MLLFVPHVFVVAHGEEIVRRDEPLHRLDDDLDQVDRRGSVVEVFELDDDRDALEEAVGRTLRPVPPDSSEHSAERLRARASAARCNLLLWKTKGVAACCPSEPLCSPLNVPAAARSIIRFGAWRAAGPATGRACGALDLRL